MPDPTQTLSVEIPRDLAEDVVHRHRFDSSTTGKLAGILRESLSQPEHQGDGLRLEDAIEKARHGIEESECFKSPWPEPASPYELAKAAASAILPALPQPPAPALSDKEREQLERIALDIEARIGERGFQAQIDADYRSAAFLRDLASRERGVGAGSQREPGVDRPGNPEASADPASTQDHAGITDALQAEKALAADPRPLAEALEAELLAGQAKVLAELAEELERRAEGYAKETAIYSAYLDGAALCREKIAELKEGKRR